MQQFRAQTPAIAPDLIVPIVADDTEEAAWMVMGDRQFWSATNLASMLHIYAQTHHLPWYVAGLLPIRYRRPGERRRRQVAPDVMVAVVPQRPRESYDLEQEGAFPAFVVDVLSQSSVARDTGRKRRLYEALGAQEYVLFAPEPSCCRRRCKATGAASQGASRPCRRMRTDGCGVRCWGCGSRPRGERCGRCNQMGSVCSPTRRKPLRAPRRPRRARGRRRSWPGCTACWSTAAGRTDVLLTCEGQLSHMLLVRWACRSQT